MKIIKVREMQKELRRLGCEAIRIKGSHEVWKLPNGNCLTIVANHKNAEVSRTVMANVMKALADAGLAL